MNKLIRKTMTMGIAVLLLLSLGMLSACKDENICENELLTPHSFIITRTNLTWTIDDRVWDCVDSQSEIYIKRPNSNEFVHVNSMLGRSFLTNMIPIDWLNLGIGDNTIRVVVSTWVYGLGILRSKSAYHTITINAFGYQQSEKPHFVGIAGSGLNVWRVENDRHIRFRAPQLSLFVREGEGFADITNFIHPELGLDLVWMSHNLYYGLNDMKVYISNEGQTIQGGD